MFPVSGSVHKLYNYDTDEQKRCAKRAVKRLTSVNRDPKSTPMPDILYLIETTLPTELKMDILKWCDTRFLLDCVTAKDDIFAKILLEREIDWFLEIAYIQALRVYERLKLITEFYLHYKKFKSGDKNFKSEEIYDLWSNIIYDEVPIRFIRKFAKYICTSKLVGFVQNDKDSVFKELSTRKIDWSDALWSIKNYNYEELAKIAMNCEDDELIKDFWQEVEYSKVSTEFLLKY